MLLKLNIEKLRELLKDFYTLTKIKIAFFDSEFNEILYYPDKKSDFCSIIKKNPELKRKCDFSDKNAFNICKKTGCLYSYKCHIGLIEVAAPIKVNNIVLGYIMFGQLFENKNKPFEKEHLLNICKGYNFDEIKLLASVDKLIHKSPEQIKAASKILESCASYLWISELVKVSNEELFYKIDKYIESVLPAEIKVLDLCNTFCIRRSKLYETSNKYFGMGISEYIKKKRINEAKKLLLQTDDLIYEIALKVGITDYNYFTKVFKNYTGFTPKMFRKSKINLL